VIAGLQQWAVVWKARGELSDTLSLGGRGHLCYAYRQAHVFTSMADHLGMVWRDARAWARAYSTDTMSAEVIKKLLEDDEVPDVQGSPLGGEVDDEDGWRAEEFSG
jgi:hypothetical protein